MARPAELPALLEGLPGVALRLAEPVARHGALRIGGEVEAWLAVFDEGATKAAINALRATGTKLRHHDPLGDHFAREEGLSGALLRLGPAFAGVEVGSDRLRVGAAAPLARIGVVAANAGIEHWAPLRSWPGTFGAWLRCASPGAVIPSLLSLRTLKGRSLKDRSPEALSKLGAGELVLGAELRLESPAPLPAAPSFPGCVVEPEEVTVRAMARSRLPGLRLRSIRLASEQVGLVVNLGGGTSADLELVIRLVKERLLRDHGLEVEPRLALLGRPPKKPQHLPDHP